MYFIKIKPLKDRLANRSMSDREALPYYLVFMASVSVASWVTMPPPTTHWHTINNWAGLLIILGGTVFTYAKNGGRTGYDFIQKSVVLGWVITVRLLPVFLCGIIGVALFKQARGIPVDQTSWADVIYVAVFLMVYYQRLGRHIQDTDRKNELGPPPLPPVSAGLSDGAR